MDSAVLNTHQKPLQRPHTNDNLNGPRVSFNKDVHVKRIGKLVILFKEQKKKKNTDASSVAKRLIAIEETNSNKNKNENKHTTKT